MTDHIHLAIDGAVATITNDNDAKHNAFDDEMDARLFAILAELRDHPEVAPRADPSGRLRRRAGEPRYGAALRR